MDHHLTISTMWIGHTPRGARAREGYLEVVEERREVLLREDAALLARLEEHFDKDRQIPHVVALGV